MITTYSGVLFKSNEILMWIHLRGVKNQKENENFNKIFNSFFLHPLKVIKFSNKVELSGV